VIMAEARDYYIHPLYILITLILASVTALFVGFTAAYIYSRVQNGQAPVNIPTMFFVNTLFLIGSSFTLRLTKTAYEKDETAKYKLYLVITFILSLIFLVLQIIAWREMIAMNIAITSSTLAGYLYVISGVHFVHVIAGLPFLAYFIWDAKQRLVEPISVLVYLSDPDKKRKLKVLSVYWHFLDALWIYLVLFFLINRYIH